jgi:hypothetical protein
VAFDTSGLASSDRLVVDAGIGTEHQLAFGDYDIFLSVIWARALRKPDDMREGNGFRFAIRTVR